MLINNPDQIPFGKWKLRSGIYAIVDDANLEEGYLSGYLLGNYTHEVRLSWNISNLAEVLGDENDDLLEQIRGEKESEYAFKLREEWINRSNRNKNSETP